MATVNAINTIEDLVQIMDARPEWVEAMRARLLTREILELPERISRLTEQLDRYVASTNRRLDKIEIRLDAHDARFDAIDARLDAHDARFDAIDARLDAHDARFDSVDAAIQKLRNDIAPLKAAHARNAALEDAITIADDMGLRYAKTLTRGDIWKLTESADTTDIPINELRSFRRADLIMEATDQNREICYIAVEISFTANGRDTTRATRNAEFLMQFTGKRAAAAIAGLNRDARIQESIEAGEIFWYQLDPDQMEVE